MMCTSSSAAARAFSSSGVKRTERSAVVGLFSNKWLWGVVLLSFLLQAAVIYIPFLQQAFSTVGLSASDWLLCAAMGSSMLWLRQSSKVTTRATSRSNSGKA